MYEVLAAGEIAPGGLNFDAKVRRESVDPVDRFHGHIAGMDAFAKGIEVAHQLLEDGVFESTIEDRYASYEEGIGASITAGDADFETLADHALDGDEIDIASGHQEKLENFLNQYVLET